MAIRLTPPLLMLLLACAATASCLPVAIKNKATTPMENYPVFIVVERDRLAEEGIRPETLCAVDAAGDPVPLWVVPETANASKVALYVLVRYLAPGDQTVVKLVKGSCRHDPGELFTFFDDFEMLDTSRWLVISSPQVQNATVRAGRGLYIEGTYTAPQQYLKVLSPPLTPPLTVEALVTPLTGFDHDACLDVYVLGTEGAHPSQARGAYIHAWGWGSPLNDTGTLTWYRVAGPPGSERYFWDVTTWEEGGPSPVWEAGDTFLFRISACQEGVRYVVYKLEEGRGLERILANWNDLGILNETVIGLGQECGGAYNFTQKALFHWVLVRPYVHPEPRVEVGVERISESPFEPLIDFLSKPANQVLLAWGVIVAALVLVLATKALRRSQPL